jgi:deazaflavin-dependent oxidoreductase (nitroreductase family)
VPLYAFKVDSPAGSWAVVGSRGGSREIPAWFRNIQERPEVTVEVDRLAVPCRAREAAGDEYEAIFEEAAAVYPGYQLYRRESPIHIPIVVLEPAVSPEATPGAGT